ncbi:substrate-binding protein [Amphritea balenae]|uniref:Branched-chain amino acid ABC transporter substrate-binding protein n=1 Tax=Amphritea balenae TaxID=452629 RepID=A0A3P1SQZ1_9GAMM|nr:substrate-binding protein [Amphritea balenae]RRC99567.1 branched-chain amino acid ABC transporter substrate-binding protein [Amphritea balenae]GGK78097.1 urea ABC transporter substrate-binding protein [Amphritea balenae]
MKALLFSVLFCLLTGCDQTQSSIKIGVVLPLTGDFKIYGEQGLNGIRLAVSEINEAGGVLNGRPLELIVRDNNTSPSETVRLGRELIQIDNVFALFGPVSSNARNALLEVAEKHQIPMFYGIDYEGGEYSRYLYCLSAIPDHYVKPVVPYLQQISGDNFYIFGYDYIWPQSIAKSIISEVNKGEGVVVGREFTPFGISSYLEVLERINRSGADNLMLLLAGPDGFRFLEQFSRYPFDRNIRVMAYAADENYLQSVTPQALEGVMTALHFFNSHKSPDTEQYVRNYRARFGDKSVPTYASKASYQLTYLLRDAIEKAGVLDREKVIDASLQLEPDPEQEVMLREDHHFDLPMYLGEFRQGSLKVIQELGVVSPSDQRLQGSP